jgi:DNA polymerase V
MMTILSEFTPTMEIYSIDEAFLKFEGFDYFDLQKHGEEMHRKVRKYTGLPISVGIAPTKALAKVANRIAKKFPDRTKSVYVIDDDEKRIKALKWLKVEDVWGIGRQHTKRLQAKGVFTAYDFTQLPDWWISKNMAVTGLRLKKDLEGIPTLDLDEVQPKQSIATTRTFERNHTEFEQIAERVSTFASSCAEKLRSQNSCCNTIMVFVHTNPHRKDQKQYSRNIVVKLPYPTSSSMELSHFATQALKRIFREGYAYKKAGVIVSDFTPQEIAQTTLFEKRNEKHIPLMKAVDFVNKVFGQQKVRLASQDLKRVWKMRQERLSPQYTTKLSDIITINV